MLVVASKKICIEPLKGKYFDFFRFIYNNFTASLGAPFGFYPNSDSAEFGLFKFDQFTFGLLHFLGLKFISKSILGHNILQLTYFFFFFSDSPSPATYREVVSWWAGVYWGNPAQCAVVSQLMRSDGSYKYYYT